MDGLLVGHHERTDGDWLTGTTVLIFPEGAVGGVDVRGGAPGTRETDLLDPRNLVQRVHGIVLTGGSAYGLNAVAGVMDWLEERRIGFPIGRQPHEVVPIVPAAVLFDLGRGGDFGARPTTEFGRLAAEAATEGPVRQGVVGAGTGALAAGLKGGLGHAETVTPSGYRLEAIAAVNAIGSAFDPATGRLYGRASLPAPAPAEVTAAASGPDAIKAFGLPPLATTIGAIVTDARLDKAWCARLAGSGQDGLARAIRPAHTMFDGDTVFALSAGDRPVDSPEIFTELLIAAADTFAHAIVNGVLAAESVRGFRSYRDLFPSVFG